MKRFASLLAIVVLSFSARAQKATRDIPYTTDSSGQQLADLYQPVGNGPFPAIVYIHGGSWRSGSKGGFAKLAQDLAAKGYVGFSINYDLHPKAWPLAFDESLAAVRFLRAHAAEYRIDPAQIVVAGTSAGGELAALVALKPQPGSEVAAAILLNGVFDMHADVHVINRYLGGRCADLSDACREASPLNQIHGGAPPFFIGHGTEDRVVGYAEAQSFTIALRQSGIAVTTYDAAGGPHMYWEKKPFYAANLAAVASFLSAVLPASPAAH